MPDAGHHALHEVRRARVVEAPEAERVEVRDRTRAHGEHVAQDAAHARRRTLEGLDERGMVVALDLEHRGEPTADVDRARVLARALQHPRAPGRQLAQEGARALVRAVLGPHDREHAELLQRGGAPEQRHDLRPLLAREALLVLERRERALVGDVAALAVLDRQLEYLARAAAVGEERVRGLHPHGDEVAHEAERAVGDQRPGEQPRLAQDLEAVADAQHEATLAGVPRHGVHDGREHGQRAAAEGVAVREAARQDHAVRAAERAVLGLEGHRLVAQHALGGAQRVPVVVGAGEDDHPPAHQRRSSASSTRKSSITPLASSRSHISRTRAEAVAEAASSSRSSTYLPTFTSCTSAKPRAWSELWTALPWGSKMPRFGVT